MTIHCRKWTITGNKWDGTNEWVEKKLKAREGEKREGSKSKLGEEIRSTSMQR